MGGMGGWVKHLGFAIPLIFALDNDPAPSRYGRPQRHVCYLCKRKQDATYRVAFNEWVCDACIYVTFLGVKVQRTLSHARSIDEHPVEVVNPHREISEHEAEVIARFDKWVS